MHHAPLRNSLSGFWHILGWVLFAVAAFAFLRAIKFG